MWTHLEIFIIEAPQLFATTSLVLRRFIRLQFPNKVIHILDLVLFEETPVLEELFKVVTVARIILRHEAIGQYLNRIEGDVLPQLQYELLASGVKNIIDKALRIVRLTNRPAASTNQRFGNDKYPLFAMATFGFEALFPELIDRFAPASSSLRLFLAYQFPDIIITKRQCRQKTEKMRFAGTEFCLNPVSLPNRFIPPLRPVRRSHQTQNIIQEWTHRIDLKLFNRLTCWHTLFPRRLIRSLTSIGPDMLLQCINRNNFIRYSTYLIQSLAISQ